MDNPSPLQCALGRQPRLFLAVASFAVFISLAAIGSQLTYVAAPLWKGGSVAVTLLNLGRQFVLSVPILFYIAGLYFARRVFQRIGSGELFARANGTGLLALGRCVLIGALWALCAAGLEPYSPGQPLALTLQSIGTSASEVVLAALGLGLMMIGRLMIAAAGLKAENDAFV